MIRILITFFICIFVAKADINSQIIRQDPFQNISQPDTTTNEGDTIINKNGFFSLFKGKPGKAALFSLIIPSGGQIYNKKWWKVPLALGIDGGLTYTLISNRKNYALAQSEYEFALSQPGQLNISTIKQKRDFYRKWSEYSWIWLIAGHLLTVVDAYVDRHLMDFDVSDDLTQGQGWNNIGVPLYAKAGLKINLWSIQTPKPNPLILAKP
jgi:Family of unknown function (DUF5683)